MGSHFNLCFVFRLVGCRFWGVGFFGLLGRFFVSGYTFIPNLYLMCRPKNGIFCLEEKINHLY